MKEMWYVLVTNHFYIYNVKVIVKKVKRNIKFSFFIWSLSFEYGAYLFIEELKIKKLKMEEMISRNYYKS